jgi:hypothetical protein
VLVHVAGADAVVDRVLKPAGLDQQTGKRGFADTRHAQNRYSFLREIAEIMGIGKLHGPCFSGPQRAGQLPQKSLVNLKSTA